MPVRHGRGRVVRTLALVGVLVLAACSSNVDRRGSDTHGGQRSTGSVSGSEAPASPSARPSGPLPVLTTTRFQTPSGNIVCESSSSSFLCVIGSGLSPEPSHDLCPVDWIGVFIQVGDYAGPACSGDPGISREAADVLAYGQTWALDEITCISEPTGLTCHDERGNGFTLARAGWSLLGKRAAARSMFPTLRSMVRKRARSDLPGRVGRVAAPVLRGGDDCGELQEAFVEVELADGRPAVYTACYVSGTWDITAGPLYPD